MTTRRTNTETQSRVCPLCNETVPAFSEPNRNNVSFLALREAHASQCKGVIPGEVAADALVIADAFQVAGGDESKLAGVDEIIARRPLQWWRDLARAVFEKKYPHQARIQETDDRPGRDTHSTGDRWKPHDREARRGWFTLRVGVAVQYSCRYCRIEIVQSIGGDPANERVAEELADRHATLCALHVVGGLREPTLSAPKFPDPERPDFK